MPAPPRIAPPTDSTAAPVYWSLPASTPSTPRRYLSDSADGRGRIAATSAACKATHGGLGQVRAEADVDQLGRARMAGARVDEQARLPGPERHRHVGHARRRRAPRRCRRRCRWAGRRRPRRRRRGGRARPAGPASAAGWRSPPWPPMPVRPSMIRSAAAIAARALRRNAVRPVWQRRPSTAPRRGYRPAAARYQGRLATLVQPRAGCDRDDARAAAGQPGAA